MPARSPFNAFYDILKKLIDETDGRLTYENFLKVYINIKKSSNIVEVVGKRYDVPEIFESDIGFAGKQRKQKNKLYTWVKNSFIREAGEIDTETTFQKQWTSYADRNPNFVLEYILSKEDLLMQVIKAAPAPIQTGTESVVEESNEAPIQTGTESVVEESNEAPIQTEIEPVEEESNEVVEDNVQRKRPRWTSRPKKYKCSSSVICSDNIPHIEVHHSDDGKRGFVTVITDKPQQNDETTRPIRMSRRKKIATMKSYQ